MLKKLCLLVAILVLGILLVLSTSYSSAVGCPDNEWCAPTPTIDYSTFCHPGAHEGGAYLCPTNAPNTDETSVPYRTPVPAPTQDAYPAPEATSVYNDPYPAPIDPYPPKGEEVERDFEQGYPRPEPTYLDGAVDNVSQSAEENKPQSLWDWFVEHVLSKPSSHPVKKGGNK